MQKDDLGVEYDEIVGEALKDPKSTVLRSVLDYFLRRKKAEELIEEKKLSDVKPKGPFGSLF